MTDSDSQNASIADYDEEVEHLSDEEVDIMSYSPEVIYRSVPTPERAAEQDKSSSSSRSSSSSSSGSGSSGEEEEEEGTTSGRQGPPTEGVRETPTRVVGDHPEAVQRRGVRESTPESAEEDAAGPAAPAVVVFEFLNSENVEQQMSRLTKAMAEFGDEDAPLPPPAKISLGGKKKAKAKPAGEKEIPSARPLSTSTVTTGKGFIVEPSDVLITRVEVAQGKEKVPDRGVTEVGGMKRRREQRSPSPSVGRERDVTSILARIGNAGPAREDLGKMTPTQVAEKIGYDLAEISRAAQLLQGRAMLAEEADHHKKTAARRLKEIKDIQAELEKAQKGLKKSEEDRVLAEKVAQRAIGEAKELKARLDNPSELVQTVFKDSESGSAFLTAARGTKVGEDLIVSFGRWAFKSGQRKMLERARTRLEQALDGEDLQLVLSALPPDLADPGPSPFAPKEKAAEPGASSAATSSGKEAAAGARELKK
ncbi:PREDICTED: histone-lysine N-methyltransferase SETD1A-like [Ipomoea nil]|uniref:histone-lysine N-methyltransferase SETD1A-like n=1 Tax=Ipomoea nil TaxID=35883 RepID=UPI0009019D93|nr:PREDICTED: histone-lysine N-methyltransferase SETD1A-like [Ipomoea nil]